MLDVRGLDVHYGGIQALRGIDMRVERGEIVALLGSNGAGKTTTLRAISGLTPASGGTVSFENTDLRKKGPDEIVRLGIGHSPEGRRVFARMTVRENLDLGAYTVRSRAVAAERLDYVLAVFPRLKERLDQFAGTLSGGEQQMLAIGRALMCGPQLLLLDEPSLGLSPILVQTIFAVISEINVRGTTILLVEQNATQALRMAHRGYVLETGTMRFEGTGSDLLDNPAVAEAYLGKA
ncbi:MAG: ABC transporter ATP-binding protein [Candidatus Eremiobacteraeota bacterium]|nr:ABC transporter ATP-binding protein [Candidatus Eremiobacteraeota bacterium]